MKNALTTKRAGPSALRRAIRLACCAAALAMANAAQADDPDYNFNIPARDLDDALRQFGALSDTQILFSPELVRGKRSAPVRGRLSINQAMDSLLANSSLTYTRTAASVIVVTQAAVPAATPTS